MYYELLLALSGRRKNYVFTYYSEEKLSTGQLVEAPFGNSSVSGVVLAIVKKPSFKTKELETAHNYLLPATSLKLLEWLRNYYPNLDGEALRLFLPPDAAKSYDVSPPNKVVARPLVWQALTTDQDSAVKAIGSLPAPYKVILHGVTGSGKTRVYIDLIQQCLRSGKSAMVLYPEIALSKQITHEIRKHFPHTPVHSYHSGTTKKARQLVWQAALQSSKPAIYTGTRSSLFLPLSNLGLVVMDESHDRSYKQDTTLRYFSPYVALKLASLHKSNIVLGSATPDITTTHILLSKGASLLRMQTTAIDHRHSTNYNTIDMTQSKNRKADTISTDLDKQLRRDTSDKMQSLLFINKRGTARSVLCDSCGWQATCKSCELPLTYHHDSFRLVCHLCGRRQSAATQCPDCGEPLQYRNYGIKAIEQDILKAYPGSRIARFDSDNKKKDTLGSRFHEIKDGSVDIIIGTQLITKGLDLPLLRTVGILQADSSLSLPDYTSEELAFQQLTQVSGRVGRGHGEANVFIQTRQPHHPIFALISRQDWQSLYEQELEKRKVLGFPPHKHALKLWVQHTDEAKAKKEMDRLVSVIDTFSGVKTLGPAPPFYGKMNGKHSLQIVVLSSSRQQLVELCQKSPLSVFYDLDPVSFM